MKKALRLLGFDFGASSGRAMLGSLIDGKLTIEEVHRFSHDPVKLCGRFVWDIPVSYTHLFVERPGADIVALGVEYADAQGAAIRGVDSGQ